MSAFADFLVTFGAPTTAPPTRRPENAWRPAGALQLVWSASLAADVASTLVQTRDVAPWSVWLLGELSRYDSLSVPADPLGAFVLDLRSGREKPSALDGHFILFGWNADAREWHVWTNRFGTMHAYVGLGARRAALGTFHPAVSSVIGAQKLDWVGLSGFFAMGFFPEDRTHFERVRILRPAMHYVFGDDAVAKKAERYWQWTHTPERAPDFELVLEQFGTTLGDVLRDETAGRRTAVPLSGGLDSRTVAALLTEEPRDGLWLYSYGYDQHSEETRIARRVAKARGLPCESYVIGEYLFDRMHEVLAATEGFNDVTQTRQTAITGDLASHADTVVAAHWGDVWLDDCGVSDHHSSSADDTDLAAAKMMKGGRAWLLDHLCAPQLGVDPEREVREGISRELSRLQHIEDRDFRVKALKTDSWSFRWTTVGLRAYQLGVFPKLPFYDTRLTDLFCTLPTKYVRGRRLQIEWLTRYASDLARITWQAHDANLYLYAYVNSLLLPKRALKKAWRMLTGAKVVERNWEVQYLSPAGRSALNSALLRPGLRVHEFASPAVIRDLLEQFFARPLEGKRGYTVSMLLTFSAWLERYA